MKVTRRTLDNMPDPAFNSPSFFFGNGICGRPDLAQAIAIESNGQIVVGGIAAMPNFQTAFGVARLLADGSLDATFGNGGRVTTMFSGRSDQIDALAVQPDGNILGVGLTATGSEGHSAVALGTLSRPVAADCRVGHVGQLANPIWPEIVRDERVLRGTLARARLAL